MVHKPTPEKHKSVETQKKDIKAHKNNLFIMSPDNKNYIMILHQFTKKPTIYRKAY